MQGWGKLAMVIVAVSFGVSARLIAATERMDGVQS